MSSAFVRIIKFFFDLLSGFPGTSHFLINCCCLRTHIMSSIFMSFFKLFLYLLTCLSIDGWCMVNSSNFSIVIHDTGHRFPVCSSE